MNPIFFERNRVGRVYTGGMLFYFNYLVVADCPSSQIF